MITGKNTSRILRNMVYCLYHGTVLWRRCPYMPQQILVVDDEEAIADLVEV